MYILRANTPQLLQLQTLKQVSDYSLL